MPEALTTLAANRPLLLADLPCDARIVQGEVGVFALDGDSLEDAVRHPLFTVGPGDVLACVPRDSGSLALLAVPFGPAEIRTIPADEEAETLQGWARQLTTLGDEPAADVPVAEAGRIVLEPGQTIRLPDDGWIQLMAGAVHWMGQPDLRLMPELDLLPIGGGTWLEAAEPSELLLLGPGAEPTEPQLQAGRAALAALSRPLITAFVFAHKRQASERVRAWMEADTQALEAAHGNLAAILAPDTEGIPGGNPLFAAMTVIGGTAGITFRKAPPGGNGFKDPLQAIARASHVRYRFVRLEGDWWRRDNGPLLAFDAEAHAPIALLPHGSARYRYVDPTRRTTGRVDAAMAESLRPEAVMFYRPFPDAKLSVRDLLDFAWRLIRADARVIVAVAVLSALLGIAIPQTIYWLMTTSIPSGDRTLLLELGLALFMVSAVMPILRLVQDFAVLRAEARAESALEAALWDRVLGARLSFFRTKPSGEIAQRMGTIGQLRRMLAGTTVQSIVSGVFSVTFLAQLFLYNVPMALAGLGVGVILVAYMAVSAKLSIRERQRVSRPAANTQAQVIEMIDGLAKIRGAKAESRAFANAVQSYALREREDFLAQAFQDRMSLFIDVLPILSTALFYVGFAAEADLPGSASQIGAFIAFSAAFSGFLNGAQGMGNAVATLINSEHRWNKLKNLLDAPLETKRDGTDPGPLEGSLSLRHVSFRYDAQTSYVLRDLSCEIAPGEFVAVVGGSGSGKSTLLRLLLGFEQAESGKIYLDGNDVAGLDLLAVRRQIGTVLQHGRLSKGALYEAIAGGRPLSHAEARAAAEAAGLADDIAAMPLGLYTTLNEGGSNLSAGQRQRVFIARALAQRPSILLLDEATSALDGKTQALISERLRALDCTRVVVANRLSTVRHADRILVLESGSIVESGTFEDLVAQRGVFCRLMESQLS